MSNNNLDEKTIESYLEDAKNIGEEAVKEKLQNCIDFYQKLIEEAKRTPDEADAAKDTEKALIMSQVYPDLKKYEKRLEELFSTYRTANRPTEI